MKILGAMLLSAIMIAAPATPAFAKVTVIAELGSAPLLGEVSSTKALKLDIRQHERTMREAGRKLGLTPIEYANFRQKLADSHASWVIVPRRLDAMTWSKNGRAYVIHNVMIPAKTNGWEVDLREPGKVIALFVPAKCGNLSVVRRSVPVVAYMRHAPSIPHLAAPPIAQAVQATPAPAPQVAAVDNAPPPPADTIVTPHRLGALPLIAAVIIGLIGGGGSSSGGGSHSAPPCPP